MALSPSEQEIYDFVLASLPPWYRDEARDFEWVGGVAKGAGAADAQGKFWFSQAMILDAVGATGSDPDWLNQHAVDRGTSRQAGETDEALRERIRNTPDLITRPALLSAAQAIVDGEGIVGTVALVELLRDKAFFGDNDTDAGTGGVITVADGDGFQTFAPNVAFARPPFRAIEEEVNYKLVLSGTVDPLNAGTFPIISLVDDACRYSNPIGIAETDAALTWVVDRHDRDDNKVTGFNRSYLSRGYRAGSHWHSTGDGRTPFVIIVIIPYGSGATKSTAGTEASMAEMLRQKKGAGVLAVVERRTS